MIYKNLFKPKSIAVIGASRDKNSVGYGLVENLKSGSVLKAFVCKGFRGDIYPVNPNVDYILGLKCYPSVLKIKDEIDLAIIAVPAKIVLKVLQECARKKINVVIIISSGFAELGNKGKKMQDEIVSFAKTKGIRILGPNCLGFIRPAANLNASFAPSTPLAGNVAFISQSGALADSVIDWAIQNEYGFSFLVSYGNQADLDVSDFLEFAMKDEKTKGIAIYLEWLKNGRRFMEVAKRVSKVKPIIVIKAGKHEKGIKAVSSHTGSLASEYEIYKAAFRQSGVHVVDTVEELLDAAKILSMFNKIENNVAVVTNGGGCGVLAADYCQELGINLVELRDSTIKKLDKSGVMHPAYNRRNPLDIVGDALADRYRVAIETLLAENYISGLIVIQTLQTMTQGAENARVVIEAVKKFKKPIICSFLGGYFTKGPVRLLTEAGIPNFDDVKKAVKVMSVLVE